MKFYITIMVTFLFLNGCKKEFKNERDFYKWWNEQDNGLVKSKTINDFKVTVKFMPPEYLTYNEVKENRKLNIDTIRKKYFNSRTFLLTIEPVDSRKDVDLLFQGIISLGEYKERVMKLNFSPGDFIKIKTNTREYFPVLSTMENVYNIDVKKNLYLVFSNEDNLLDEPELDFVFNDQIFETGITHFLFQKKNMDNIPEFKFL